MFPQCVKDSHGGEFTPHLTVAKFKNQKELKDAQARFQKDWKPITWAGARVAFVRSNSHCVCVRKQSTQLT